MNERDVFIAALERADPAERRAYLDDACRGDDALRRGVEALLDAHERAGSFLDPPDAPPPLPPPRPPDSLGEWVARLVQPQAAGDEVPGLITAAMAPSGAVLTGEGAGAVLGPYKLLDQLGEGGFGVVFLAEQQQPVRRRVALKVLKPGMDTRQVVARFEAERQALALMDHPHIAKVFDGGETPGGRPYFVMELVQGLPVTEFCDDRRLTVRERLTLFVDVCSAVQHAHQKGVIHRDLKPSNVLVAAHDGKPAVKVIDFGIAKAVGQPLTDKSIHTQAMQLLGTPLYMAPEQAGMCALDVDTRTDIYALGVLLYELLTGATPFDPERFRKAGYEEICRILREEEPPRPSARLSGLGPAAPAVTANRRSDAKRLKGLLRGELDWVVMKCLEKDRGRRYESASGLARDVERFLRDEPVQACPPSTGYRLRKFLRRNKGPVLGAVSAVVLLLVAVVGLTVSTWLVWQEQDRTRAALRQAQTNYEQAEAMRGLDRRAVDDYLTTVSESTLLKSRLPGLQPLRKELLEHALRYYQRFLEQKGDDPELAAEAASAYFRVGSINEEIGNRADALRAFEKARDLYEALRHRAPPSAARAVALAKAHRKIGRLHWASGARQPALQSVRQAVALSQELTRTHPGEVEVWAELARGYGALGALQREQGPPAADLETLQQAVALWQKIVREHPDAFALKGELTECFSQLCRSHYQLGHSDEALQALQQAIEIGERLVREHPHDTRFLSNLAFYYRGRGYLQRSRGQLTEMVGSFRDELKIAEKLFRDNPAVTQFRLQVATSSTTLSGMLSDLGQLDEALRLSEQARALMAPLAKDNPTDAQMQTDLALSYASLGNVLRRKAQTGRALEAFRQASAVLDKLPRNADVCYNLACMLALCSSVVGQGKTELTVAEQEQRRRYADQAMDALRQAVAAGSRNPGELRHDSELDAVRSRADFQQLLADLEAKRPIAGKAKTPSPR